MLRAVAAAAAVAIAALVVVVARGDDADEPVAGAAAVVRRDCDRFSSVRWPGRRDAERDVRAGRLAIGAFRDNYESAPEAQVPELRGAKLLKAPVVFTGRTDLVLSVPRGVPLKLDFFHERPPLRRIRFEACPRGRGATGFPGGLLYRGPWPACPPLHVSGVGRIRLPLGKRCP